MKNLIIALVFLAACGTGKNGSDGGDTTCTNTQTINIEVDNGAHLPQINGDVQSIDAGPSSQGDTSVTIVGCDISVQGDTIENPVTTTTTNTATQTGSPNSGSGPGTN